MTQLSAASSNTKCAASSMITVLGPNMVACSCLAAPAVDRQQDTVHVKQPRLGDKIRVGRYKGRPLRTSCVDHAH